jgi:hypothetical protein
MHTAKAAAGAASEMLFKLAICSRENTNNTNNGAA